MKELLRRFPDFANYRVLDLGGTLDFWRSSTLRPASVTVVNLDSQITGSEGEWARAINSDACEIKPELLGTFDFVFSNSLLEHVGGYERRIRMANVVERASRKYWIQTPDRYFPIEPHWVFPGLQFLPIRFRAMVAQHWHVGHMRSRDYNEALHDCLATELVSASEMRVLFPDAEIWHERLYGISKSLVAIGGAQE